MQKLLLPSSEIEKDRLIYTEKVVKDGKQTDLEICHGTLIINYRKAISQKPVAFIEDIWTHEDFRKLGHGRKLVKELIKMAKQKGCYKAVLFCSEENVPFYCKIGFKRWQNGLRYDL